MTPFIEAERRKFHEDLFDRALCNTNATITKQKDGKKIKETVVVCNIADKDNKASREISKRIVEAIEIEPRFLSRKPDGQQVGNIFEKCCADFVRNTFPKLQHLRVGNWDVEHVTERGGVVIARYEQYAHLLQLDKLAAANKTLKSALGNDYSVAPDVVVTRKPEADEILNEEMIVVGDEACTYASLRRKNNEHPILHASLSCKWTIRSDRSQNSRSEALNLLRNRKGRAPHICVITAEPTPSRLASVALGTGDLDCVYHFALPELIKAVSEFDEGDGEATSLLNILIEGKRLRDISDLPLDLAI